jgi:zinc transporter ZupT
MWTFLIISAAVLFIAALTGGLGSRLITPGTLLMFAQAFSSGSFIGVSVLHFMPQAAAWLSLAYPLSSLIIVAVFVVLFLCEFVAIRLPRAPSPLEDSHELSASYSLFIMRQFTAIPSLWLEIAAYLFFLAHCIFLAFPFVFVSEGRVSPAVALLVVVAIEKVLEGFTVALLFRRIARSPAAIPLLLLYAAATPAAILAIGASSITDDRTWCAVCLSVSAGVFLFMGFLMWRRSFLTPFDWKKWEIALFCALFVAGIALAAGARIEETYV